MPLPPVTARLMPSHIANEVLSVLQATVLGHDGRRSWVTAYQIFYRLPVAMRKRLEAERGPMGDGGGNPYAAGNVIADACEILTKRGKAEIGYLDAGQLRVVVDGAPPVKPSYDYCGIYRAV